MHVRLTRLLVGTAVALTAASTLLPATDAAAAPAPGTTSSKALSFGPILDWKSDDAQRYSQRLGGTPQFYGQSVSYPMGETERSQVDVTARAAAAQGADVLLQLLPDKPLAALTVAEADDLATQLDGLSRNGATRFVVDFAPEMNGSWTTWGQQPLAYVAAFRRIADAVHRGAPGAEMAWEPANGAGYPFGGARGEVKPSGPRVKAQLDTDGNGKVTEADDPYGPYWPGTAAVDRVGLSVFWYGRPGRLGVDDVPTADWFRDSLAGTAGYATPGTGRDFVTRFSTAVDKPLFVETGALTMAAAAGTPSADAIATNWIRQVFDPAVRADYPSLDTVAWLEQRRPEAESGGRAVDWRVTAVPQVRTVLRTQLSADGVTLGPLSTSGGRTQANAAATQAFETATGGGQTDRILGGIGVLAGLFVLAGLATRFRRSWRYPVGEDPDRGALHSRDGRVDVVRGFVITAVIVVHIGLAGPWSWFVDRAGAVMGAEAFVLLSGVVLGGMYPHLATRLGGYGAAVSMARRAGKLYLRTVAVILAVFFLAKIPGVDGTIVTTFTDRGTGAAGNAAAGRVYYLYGTAQHLLDYPPPGYAVRDLLFLRYGPWPMNIMGLFVILSLAVPACMWLVRRGLWWLLLVISWGLYAVNVVHPVTLFDAQFEDVFPLLAWQVAFTHGLVIGRYRARIVAALRSTPGLIAISGTLVVYLAGLLVLRSGVHLPGVPAYRDLYEAWYLRTDMDGGRLLDLAIFLVTIYAFLTACWRPLQATLGRVFEPLGRHSLDVFLLQVFAVLAVGNIPGLDQHSAWQGFAVQTVAIALIWVIVQRPWRRRSRRDDPPADVVPAVEKRRLVVSGR